MGHEGRARVKRLPPASYTAARLSMLMALMTASHDERACILFLSYGGPSLHLTWHVDRPALDRSFVLWVHRSRPIVVAHQHCRSDIGHPSGSQSAGDARSANVLRLRHGARCSRERGSSTVPSAASKLLHGQISWIISTRLQMISGDVFLFGEQKLAKIPENFVTI